MAKIGDGHVEAMARQGLRELRNSIYPSSNISNVTELGVFGTQTPGEIAEARREDVRAPEEEGPSVLQERMQQAAEKSKDVKQVKERGLDR